VASLHIAELGPMFAIKMEATLEECANTLDIPVEVEFRIRVVDAHHLWEVNENGTLVLK